MENAWFELKKDILNAKSIKTIMENGLREFKYHRDGLMVRKFNPHYNEVRDYLILKVKKGSDGIFYGKSSTDVLMKIHPEEFFQLEEWHLMLRILDEENEYQIRCGVLHDFTVEELKEELSRRGSPVIEPNEALKLIVAANPDNLGDVEND